MNPKQTDPKPYMYLGIGILIPIIIGFIGAISLTLIFENGMFILSFIPISIPVVFVIGHYRQIYVNVDEDRLDERSEEEQK